MVTLLTRRKTVSALEDILKNAKEKIVLVSPYVNLSEDNADRLRAADGRGVPITLVCRKDNLKENEKRVLQKLKHIQVYNRDNLHTKCYYNEQELIITSMNLYEFSEQNNVEMGVLFTSDETIYREARQEIEDLLLQDEHRVSWRREKLGAFARSAGKAISSGARAVASRAADALTEKGHCIRCGTRIPFNPAQPLCKEDYAEWAKHGNNDYTEEYCHRCGEKNKTSKARPQCRACYQKYKTRQITRKP